MITLRANNLRWISGPADDPTDLCAHADIEFAINGDALLDATTGANLTASAAALFLLRTLERSHTAADPVAEHLFPCCGFAMWEQDDSPDVAVCGCPNGANFEVRHSGEGVSVSADGREWSVSADEWRAAVFAFADEVTAFYAASSPKQPTDDDAPGWRAFRAEWERRRGSLLSARRESP